MTTMTRPRDQHTRKPLRSLHWLRRTGLSTATLGLAVTLGCNSTVTPPPPPDDPTTAYLLHEALHTGLVLPPLTPEDPTGYVEFGFGDWSWYALSHDSWYNVFATVLWPTQGTLGRREFGAHTPETLQRAAYWAELSPIRVSQKKANALRAQLQATFDAASNQAIERRDLRFRFTPQPDSYWFAHNCADVAATWLTQLDCTIGWAPIRTGLHTSRAK